MNLKVNMYEIKRKKISQNLIFIRGFSCCQNEVLKTCNALVILKWNKILTRKSTIVCARIVTTHAKKYLRVPGDDKAYVPLITDYMLIVL